MFFLSNSYQLKDIKADIFNTYYDANMPISHFISLDGYHVFASKDELFSLKEQKQKKIAGFKADITSLSTHQQLICAGTLNGEVHIFTEHRAAIRQFKAHNAEITDVIITKNKLVVSCSKDHAIHFHDLTEDKLIHKIDLDTDSPRKMLEINGKLIVFSKNILIYSLDDYSMIKKIENEHSVSNAIKLFDENILFISKNKAYLFNAADYDLKTGVILHTKDITSIAYHDNKIYSCSLDGHFKSFTCQLKNLNNFNFNEKLISFSIIGNIPYVISESGKFYSLHTEKSVQEQRRNMARTKLYEDDIDYEVIQSNKKVRTEMDRLLWNFMYKDALRKCFKDNNLNQSFTALKYISDKRGCMKLLKDADIDFIKNILQLCLETIKIDEFTPIVIELLMIITSIYSDELVEEPELKELVEYLSQELNEVVAFEEVFLKALSFVESFTN